jgi:bifunctional non-homologous end joining protein LigD
MPLEEYKRKRDLKKSPEPQAKKGKPSGALTFVVQKHSARRLHYDLRLELDGVLKSWALPHGPSFDPSQKHLAVMVEDHPIDYANFEGVIPAGEYGAGQVIVWDRGTYEPDSDGILLNLDRKAAENRVRAKLAAGKMSFTLHGDKLKGSWALVKMTNSPNNWLLLKHRDAFADADEDVLAKDRSVISGLTIEDLKAGNLPSGDPSEGPAVKSISAKELGALQGAKKSKMPTSIAPMLAELRPAPFSGDEWIFEPKLDGFRTLAYIDHGKVTLRSRNDTNMTKYFPSIASDLKSTGPAATVLDGEIVAVDDQGRTCFQCLQQQVGLPHEHTGKNFSTAYYVFDLLYRQGFDLTGVPWQERNPVLARVLARPEHIRLVEHFEGDGNLIFKAAVESGMEGVVAKKKQSVYEQGRRSPNWLKVKDTKSDEFVIGGFAAGAGKRKGTFASLLLGYYDGKKLVYAGSVGTGFDEALLDDIKKKLGPLITATSPFSSEMDYSKGVTWVKPKLVAEVRFAERTPSGMLRHPVFLRLRTDKKPSEVQFATPEVQAPFSSSQVVQLSKTTRHILEALQNTDDEVQVHAGGFALSLTSLNKVFWPKYQDHRALTKRDYLIYLAEVADLLLPHLKDRPLTLTRYPNGINGEKFYQKHWEFELPEYVDRVQIYSKENDAFQEYLLCNNLSTLLWLGQLADLELHTWYSRVAEVPDRPDLSAYKDSPEHLGNYLSGIPDFLIFDIDPYIYSGQEHTGEEPELNREAFKGAVEAAFWLKQTIEDLKLMSYVKTSGKTGLHVFVPLKRHYDYDFTRQAAAAISRHVESQHPDRITTEWLTAKRRGKIFLDFNQNTRGKTVASVYSARPTPWAGVSLPFRWEELEMIYPADFNIINAPARLAKVGDVWADIMKAKRDMPASLDT